MVVIIEPTGSEMNRAFSAELWDVTIFLGALPQAPDECRAVGANRVQPSAADAFQVRSVAQQRFAKRLGSVSGDQLRQITAALATVLKIHY